MARTEASAAEASICAAGEAAPRKVDVRIMAASNKDLETEVREGRFREDLYFRLNVVSIHMPPLRERKEDIPLLVNTFLEEIAEESRRPARMISPEGLKALMAYDWPGNVRQLRKVLMRAAIVTEDNVIRARDIPIPHDEVQAVIRADLSLNESIDLLRRTMIEKALKDNDGNKTKAGTQLGITRQNLQNMMRRMSIT